MKRLFFLVLLSPLAAWGQTTQKALTLTVSRTVGVKLTTFLPAQDDETATGPVYRVADGTLTIKGYTVARKRIKELRYKIETVDGIQNAECGTQNAAALPVYDLQGRRLGAWETLGAGIYIIGNRKVVKK